MSFQRERDNAARERADKILADLPHVCTEFVLAISARSTSLTILNYVYDLDLSIEDKLNAIVRRIYRGAGVSLTAAAKKQAEQLEALGFGKLPICVAKTQYSFSEDLNLRCAPEGFTITVRTLKVSAGAGFIVALAGDIMTLPGLPKIPSAEKIDVDSSGKISGLF